MSVAVRSLALAALTLVACSAEPPIGASSENQTEHRCTATDASAGDPRVYFAPFDPVVEEALCVLDTAREELLVAHYNPRHEAFLAKLVELHDRGVRVKVAVDKATAAEPHNDGDDFLEAHGIELVRVKPAGTTSIMHLKVAVIDGDYAMSGSFNWNGTAAQGNDENMVVFRDAALAARYRDQVLEVMGDKPHAVAGGRVSDGVSLHFSPEENLETKLVELIDGADRSIDVAMFTLTATSVAKALVRAATAHKQVRVIVEEKQTGLSDADERVAQAGGLVVRARNRVSAYSAMHQKYAVIDGATVITGATNWTYQGTHKNDEDLLVLESEELARRYQENFADLLSIYGGLEASELPAPAAPGVLFVAIHGGTGWGDRVVVTGADPALGSWDPWQGIVMQTSGSMFPSWTAHARFAPGTRVEYKYVHLTAAGEVLWEPGENRVLDVGRRSAVTTGPYGDTRKNWSPRTAP